MNREEADELKEWIDEYLDDVMYARIRGLFEKIEELVDE